MQAAMDFPEVLKHMSTDDQLIMIACGVIQNRFDNLTKEDQQELQDLVMEFAKSSDAEERQSIWTAMLEILAQKPMTSKPLSPKGGQLSEKSKKWAENLGSKVRDLRTVRGWTQEELAERAGLPQTHICRIEQAEYTATFKTIEKIAKVFEVAVDELVAGGA